MQQGGRADDRQAGGSCVEHMGMEDKHEPKDARGVRDGGFALEEQRAVGRVVKVDERRRDEKTAALALQAGCEAADDASAGVCVAWMGVAL